jgi:threonine synthase
MRGEDSRLAAIDSTSVSCRGVQVGNTPVVRLRKVVSPSMGEVLVKLEYYNPTGSYKDRMALAMIEGAEARRAEAGHARGRVDGRKHAVVAGDGLCD